MEKKMRKVTAKRATKTAAKADEKLQQAHSWLMNFERLEHLTD